MLKSTQITNVIPVYRSLLCYHLALQILDILFILSQTHVLKYSGLSSNAICLYNLIPRAVHGLSMVEFTGSFAMHHVDFCIRPFIKGLAMNDL